jgi:putative NADH-flavin reductase
MKLFVLGATGRTGRHVLDLALARGHEITAFVRSPHKLAGRGALRVVPGRAEDPDALAAALVGHDAVISALGPRWTQAMRPHTLLGDLAAGTVRAMTAAAVRRVVVVSAALLFPLRGAQAAFFRWLLGHHIRDLVAMEQAFTVPHLEWTIARPPRLTASRAAGYRCAASALPPGPLSMSFRAVAAFAVDAVERGAHRREIVGLGR